MGSTQGLAEADPAAGPLALPARLLRAAGRAGGQQLAAPAAAIVIIYPMTQSSLTIQHATAVLPDRITSAPLFVSRGRVAMAAPPGAWALDLRDHLVFPGLVNAHDHLQLNNIPRLPRHAPFPNSYAWMAAFQPYFREPAVARACNIP